MPAGMGGGVERGGSFLAIDAKRIDEFDPELEEGALLIRGRLSLKEKKAFDDALKDAGTVCRIAKRQGEKAVIEVTEIAPEYSIS